MEVPMGDLWVATHADLSVALFDLPLVEKRVRERQKLAKKVNARRQEDSFQRLHEALIPAEINTNVTDNREL